MYSDLLARSCREAHCQDLEGSTAKRRHHLLQLRIHTVSWLLPSLTKFLMVAEKPSSALSITSALSDGHMSTRRSSIEVHEFNGTFRGSNAQYKVTSGIGMFFSVDFPAKYQDWTITDPLDFFQAPIHKAESNPKAHIFVECTSFHRPRSGTDAGDHPPIIPMRAVNEDMLVNDAWKLYQYVCQHFIGTVSPDCKYLRNKQITLVAKGQVDHSRVVEHVLQQFKQNAQFAVQNKWLERQISNFLAKENDKFYECWERYMEAINACPHHGFDTWLLFQGGWDELNKGEVGKMKSQPNAFNAKARMYTLNEDIDMKAKVAAMTRRFEELEMKKIHEVQAVVETPVQVKPCPICQSYEHLVEECPTILAAREMFGDQSKFLLDNSSPTTMLHMVILTTQIGRNHPNFSWKPRAPQYTQPTQASQQASNLEQEIVNLSKVMGDFVWRLESINAQLSQRIDSVENTLNKRMDGMQTDLSQKIDNLQYSNLKAH
ncbi:DNA topoisomerase 3-beta [Vitis vinifera]|uniref:DNA topoisomerase n=1 Tax=Vitis vinifera TaxID=29760 RepID=A0A438ICH0_VITVI|nr:DNA topoisomerase 3-beta [Vitis vinifera]